jgi:hypothetical protein
MGALLAPRHGLNGTIAGVPLFRPCWRLQSTYGLWSPAAKTRGSYKVALADGELTTRSLREPRPCDLQLYVIGDVDYDGDANVDAFQGADDNVERLIADLWDADEDDFGTVAVSITRGTRTKAGRLALEDFEVKPGPAKESDRWVFIKGTLPLGQLEVVP